MSLRKELKKAYLKLTGQYVKSKPLSHTPVTPRVIPPPYEISVTNIVTEEDFSRNDEFVSQMLKHKWETPPKSFLCFLPYANGSTFLKGGYRTIIAINNALCQKFNAKMYLSFFPEIKDDELEEKFRSTAKIDFPDFEYEIVRYSKVWNLHVDIAMCNFWLGAYPLVKFNNCLEKYYLLQDHESLFYEAGIVSALAERTLYFGFHHFTNSLAIKKYVDFINGRNSTYRYLPGIDHETYYHTQNKSLGEGACRIICYGRPSIGRNCFHFLSKVFKVVKANLDDKVEIISVGEDFDVASYGLEGIVNNYGKYNDLQKLAELYRQCDIGVSLISTPTFSYQHFEYMASGLCLVTNKQEGIADLLMDNDNAIVCEPVVDIMAERIINLVNNPELIARVAKNGAQFAEALDWKKCFDGIAGFILEDKTK